MIIIPCLDISMAGVRAPINTIAVRKRRNVRPCRLSSRTRYVRRARQKRAGLDALITRSLKYPYLKCTSTKRKPDVTRKTRRDTSFCLRYTRIKNRQNRLWSASGMAVKCIRLFAICSFTQSDEMQSKHSIQADNSHPIRYECHEA